MNDTTNLLTTEEVAVIMKALKREIREGKEADNPDIPYTPKVRQQAQAITGYARSALEKIARATGSKTDLNE